jgi:hypothetical protein
MSDAALAEEAAAQWGLPAPVLLRVGMNSIFVAGDDVMLRVGELSSTADAEVAWMERMAQIDVRVPALLRPPLTRGARAVLAVERIHPGGDVDWSAVGAMVRRVHSLEAPPGLPFCGTFVHWQIESLLSDVDDLLDPAARAGLAACVQRWSGWRARAASMPVVCHGDVHPGNVVPTSDGPVLLDWDLRCLAPAAWDHGPLMTWTERWGGEAGLYEAFADGYGRSFRDDWMGNAIADLRLLAATLLRLRAGRSDPAAAAEAQLRLRWWRGEPSAPAWTAM